MSDQNWNPVRAEYLKTHWQPYPECPPKVLSPRDAQKKWLEMVMGSKTGPALSFLLGGRLQPFGPEKGYWVQSDGDQIEWLNGGSAEIAPGIKAADVLSTGDILLFEVNWSQVVPESDSQKLRAFTSRSVQLLVPSHCNLERRSDFSIARSRQWNYFLKLIREVFRVLEFTEVQTPTLVPSPGLEPYLDPFVTNLEIGSTSAELFLPTSPEFHLKKMLSLGWNKIFEIKTCFRNGEFSNSHQPEFLMLEWYRAYSNLEAIKKDIQSLFNYLKLHWREPVRGWAEVRSQSVAELFSAHCGKLFTPQTTKSELLDWCRELEILCDASDSWDDLFFRIFIEKIEPHLGKSGPLVVTDYPPSQAALARINHRGWADRFELYWKGLEIANAFNELNDPVEQKLRFQKDILRKQELEKKPVPVDEEFIQALEYGMPPSAGIAMGVERLFMALTDLNSIQDVRAFPLTKS